MFDTIKDAEQWLTEHWFSESSSRLKENDHEVDPTLDPTGEHYQNCARIAHEINETAAMGRLAEILPLENNHTYLCEVGIWYWSIGHRMLATMTYERSIEICPEAPTYFNLAVCCDDMGQKDRAEAAIARFYELVATKEEREQAESTLREKGKDHLIWK